jgi:hypothetical protein
VSNFDFQGKAASDVDTCPTFRQEAGRFWKPI